MGRKVTGEKIRDQNSRHLRWEIFENRIREKIPSLEPIKGTPRIDLFIAPGGSPIGARFYSTAGSSIASPLAEVAIRQIGVGKETALEVSTANPNLFRDFYAFCCAVADRVQVDRESVESSLAKTLRSWSALIRQKSLLSVEKQIGLMGELLFLRRAARVRGWTFAADSWQGPNSEEHDFTLASVDAEIKSTRSEQRVHEIESLTQLVPKLNRRLFVVSIQLTPSSGSESFSLPQLVGTVLTNAGAASARAAERIRQQLEWLGWADGDAPHYGMGYQLRAPLAAVPVDNNFPAIVPESLAGLGPRRLSRIKRVRYAVDLDGLGVVDRGRKFDQLLFPKVSGA